MHEKYSSQGLQILAFPCNNFGMQEPGENDDVKKYIEKKGVTFHVFGKIQCDNHDKTHPLYQMLKETTGGAGLGWNFHKFLCDANGVPVARGSSDPEQFVEVIEKLLAR